MGEMMKGNSESLSTYSSDNQWERLADEVPFNADQQKEAPTETEPTGKEDKADGLQTHDSVETEKNFRPIGEMEKPEIAREYMDLLHDLSSNFTSPEGVASGVVGGNGVTRKNGYQGDEDFVKKLYKSNGLKLDETKDSERNYANADLDRAHTLKMVDTILSGEQAWQDAGDECTKTQATLADAIEKLNQLQTERRSRGFFDRIKTASSFRKQTKELNAIIAEAQTDLSFAEECTRYGNYVIANGLKSAYSEDYHYGHHRLSYGHEKDQDYKEQIDEEYNNRFFGLDDPGRQEKVSRALELRRALGGETGVRNGEMEIYSSGGKKKTIRQRGLPPTFASPF